MKKEEMKTADQAEETKIQEETFELDPESELSLDDLEMVAGGINLNINTNTLRHYGRHD